MTRSAANSQPGRGRPLIALADELGFVFRRPELVRQALTHRSYGTPHNERLEFIGDAVLDCVVAAVLYERFPSIPEGALSRVRASLVDRDTLARLARKLRIGEEMRLGEAMLRSGSEHTAVAADALEAVFGAVFIDAGFDAARSVVERVYAAEFQQVDPATLAKDPKTRLQEWLQARRIAVPQYVLTAATGEAHAQTLTVECRIPELGIAVAASGPSRRVAEQAAAEQAYAAATDRDGAGGRG